MGRGGQEQAEAGKSIGAGRWSPQYAPEQPSFNHFSVEAVIVLNRVGPGGCIHDGTWQSAIYGFADSHKLQSLRRKFNHKPLPTVDSKLKRRGTLFYSNELKYTVPHGSDPLL
ncbi:saccharopine dehydrogenase-like oxidoreductase [Lates japonicus]|uniref:Saccharopine dehydrogenase-like oxidoreductase n=1 Tax=Lates japonicus TaxID=270547 RepID=A0AAD3QYI6_LATJO|nr:saccharopine dehydrogenase-like oxidoreductase [Lates japonicus]